MWVWDEPTSRQFRRSVLPVRGAAGPIGTGTVIAEEVVVTALHVIAPEPIDQLRLGPTASGEVWAVRAAVTLPLWHYGPHQGLAQRSRRRAQELTGTDDGTVDLALLVVPGLRAPVFPPRAAPVTRGEQVVVPGYPGGRWSLTQGPVVGVDEADFVAHLLLGPGASGAPAIDRAGRLAGIVTLDNHSGTICIGPRLLTAFLHRMRALLQRPTHS